MKIENVNSTGRCQERASVVLVLLIFLTLIGMLCAATMQSVHWTRGEVGLIEKRQVERLTTTNALSVSTKPPASP